MADNITEPFNWRAAIDETYQDLSQQVIDYAPQLIGALVLLILGWGVAHLCRLSTKKIVLGLDTLFKRVSKHDSVKRERIKNSFTLILSQVVFWAVILFFVAASANLLGWKMFTGWMDNVVTFLPSLITGLLIILAGFLTGNAVRSGILSTSLGTDNSQTAILARIAQIVILFSAIVVGVELIGLNMQFLTTVTVVVIGILLAGAALAFGLGAKTLVSNIIGTQYTRKHCRIGEVMKVGTLEGPILEVTQTSIILDTEKGRAIVPGRFFNEQVSILSLADEEFESTPQHISEEEAGHE